MQANRRVPELNEFGTGVATGWFDDHASFLDNSLQLKTLDYGRLSWRRYWETGMYASRRIRGNAMNSEANFLMPYDMGAVDAFLGIEFTTRRRRSPAFSSLLLRRAGNPSFIVDVRREHQ